MKKILISIVFILLFNQSVFGETIIGKATVIDGDTIKINGIKIRLLELMHQKKAIMSKSFPRYKFYLIEEKI